MAKVPKREVREKAGSKVKSSSGTPNSKKSPPAPANTDSSSTSNSSPDASPNDLQSGGTGVLLNLASMALPTLERPFIVEYFPTTQQITAEYDVRHDELMRQRRKVEKVLKGIKQEWTERALQAGQIVSLNVAYRTKFREVIAPLQYVIQVDVVRKQSKDRLYEREMFLFPRLHDGVPVKVREARAVGGPRATAVAAELVATLVHLDDIGGGASIGSDSIPNSFGTLGMCVRDVTNNLRGITNAHVAGTNQGEDVYQPPANPNNPQDRIGKVTGAPAFSDLCDAALVDGSQLASPRRLVEGIREVVDSNGNPFPPESFRFLRLRKLEPDSFLKHKNVIKVGAASGVTHGNIKDTCMDSPSVAHLPSNDFNSKFSNVIAIDNSIDPRYLIEGDSGSVAVYIVTENATSFPVVVGLNVATLESGEESYAFPFGRVMKELDLKLPEDRLWKPLGE